MSRGTPFVLFQAFLMLSVSGCGYKSGVVSGIASDSDSLRAAPSEEVIIADTAVYGRCGVNTAMHTIELITDLGDTIEITYNTGVYSGDTQDIVRGGLSDGDRLAVTRCFGDSEIIATKIINITTLLGRWSDIERDIELKGDGSVISNIKEPRPCLSWSICNGRLVLAPDTFDIIRLGPDSLYLENDKGVIGLRRR